MFEQTLQYLKSAYKLNVIESKGKDILWGEITDAQTKKTYPIWNGVLVLVDDLESYIYEHAAGLKAFVPLQRTSKTTQKILKEAYNELSEMGTEHIDESLESDRVTALYWLGHYVDSKTLLEAQKNLSPVFKEQIQKYWDHGPMQRLEQEFQTKKWKGSLLELGCGSGGLLHLLAPHLQSYLGVDTSFKGVVRAREILVSGKNNHAIPGDLIEGSLSVKCQGRVAKKLPEFCDFIVADVQNDVLKANVWDATAAFNVIDMLTDPQDLFKLQKNILKKEGLAIQSSPYIWHPVVAKELKAKTQESSEDRTLRLAGECGLNDVVLDERNIPWLFFKNKHQIETYSVHLSVCKK